MPIKFVLLFAIAGSLSTITLAQSCENLDSISLPNVFIDEIELVGAGSFVPPGSNRNNSMIYEKLPDFCRISLSLTPSADSDIHMELWLPMGTWNGKYLAVGNGAFTGNIRHSAMAMPLSRGYATSSTDTGHLGNTASFALGHPEKVYDFGWRAIHEMAETSKVLISKLAVRLRY